MTDPISGSRSPLPPDPFTSDLSSLQKPAQAWGLPPDPFVTAPRVDYSALGQTMGTRPSVAAQLDAARDAYSGPYQILGQTVTVRPQFRMNGGYNDANVFVDGKADQTSPQAFMRSLTPKGRDVFGILAKAGIVNPGGVMLGYGSPKDLVKATQALCYAGKLPEVSPPATLADAVRRMQWENGIGVDCTNYTMQALARVRGTTVAGLGLTPGEDPFQHDGTHCPAGFTRVIPATARPGDVIALRDPVPERVGHRVIVRDHSTLTDPKPLIDRWGSTAASFFKGTGPFHVFSVDSSWGAGPDGKSFGGYRSDTWAYDEGSKSWLSFAPATGSVLVSRAGPAGELLAGAYRQGGAT